MPTVTTTCRPCARTSGARRQVDDQVHLAERCLEVGLCGPHDLGMRLVGDVEGLGPAASTRRSLRPWSTAAKTCRRGWRRRSAATEAETHGSTFTGDRRGLRSAGRQRPAPAHPTSRLAYRTCWRGYSFAPGERLARRGGAPRSWLSRGVRTPWLLARGPGGGRPRRGSDVESGPGGCSSRCGLAYFWASLRYPVAALAVFVVLTFISEIAGVGAGTSVAKGAGGVLVISWLYRQFARRSATLDFDGSPGVRPFIVGSASLFAWMVISTAWASDSHAAFASALRLVQGPLIALVIVATIDSLAAFRVVVSCYVAGATASALAGMAGVTHSDSATVVESGRLGGGIGDPNFLAAVLVVRSHDRVVRAPGREEPRRAGRTRPGGAHVPRGDLSDGVARWCHWRLRWRQSSRSPMPGR